MCHEKYNYIGDSELFIKSRKFILFYDQQPFLFKEREKNKLISLRDKHSRD